MHKITQLKQNITGLETQNSALEIENGDVKAKLDKIISQQFANESLKLNTLALELDNKDYEIKAILGDKSQEVCNNQL